MSPLPHAESLLHTPAEWGGYPRRANSSPAQHKNHPSKCGVALLLFVPMTGWCSHQKPYKPTNTKERRMGKQCQKPILIWIPSKGDASGLKHKTKDAHAQAFDSHHSLASKSWLTSSTGWASTWRMYTPSADHRAPFNSVTLPFHGSIRNTLPSPAGCEEMQDQTLPQASLHQLSSD